MRYFLILVLFLRALSAQTLTASEGGSTSNGRPGSAPSGQWTQVPTPVQNVSDVDLDSKGCIYISDRVAGFERSCDGGKNWTVINAGIPAAEIACGAAHVMHNSHDDSIIGYTVVNPLSSCPGVNRAGIYKWAQGATQWVPIPQPSGFSISLPSQQPRAVPFASGGCIVFSGQGATGQVLAYSTDDGVTTHLSTENPSQGTVRGTYPNPFNGHIYSGGENQGILESIDCGKTFQLVWPYLGGTANPTNGEEAGITVDCSGNIITGSYSGIWQLIGTYPGPYTATFKFHMTQRARAVFRDSLCNLYAGQRQLNANPTVWKSKDGGNTWAEYDLGIGTGLEAQRFVEFNGWLYANIQNGSTNAGTLWKIQLQ